MLTHRRGPSFSSDPTLERRGKRERWVPLVPGEGDLRPRSYPPNQPVVSEEALRRDKDESAG